MFTIFIDLDDTLLQNNMDTFLPAYFDKLTQAIPEIPSSNFLQHLLATTQKMINNQDVTRTLEQTFDQEFFQDAAFAGNNLKSRLMDFYRDIYPDLQPFTTLRPQAVMMIDQLLARGYQTVIATNPLFPRIATYNRLSWAGLAEHINSFALVTTYESFHFAKPNLAYYAEILAKLGYPDRPAVMIGNSLQDDIIPAATLGLPCFYLEGEAKPIPEKIASLVSTGKLENVISWLESVKDAAPVYSLPTPGSQMAFLKSTPAMLHSLSQDMTNHSCENKPQIMNIIGEMIEKEYRHLQTILTDISSSDKQDFSTNHSIHTFCSTRQKLINLLQEVPEAHWGKGLADSGKSIRDYIDFILIEDRTSIKKIQAACHKY